jgi:hypothetical protein
MKHLTILVFWLNLGFISCYAQDNSSKIQDIKKMYAEIIQLSNTNSSKQCKTGKMIEYDYTNNSERYPFEQTATFCQVSKEYATYHAKFLGHEWNMDIAFYLKDKKVFFVLMTSGSEASSNEYRIYYDVKENVIKILNTSNEGDDAMPTESMKSKEIKDKVEKKRIIDDLNTSFKKVLKMTK